jgi:hypothetical protein
MPTRSRWLLALVLLAASLAGCTGSQPGPPLDDGTNDTTSGNDTDANGTQPPTTIAWQQVPAPGEVPEPDRQRLAELVERQVYPNGTEDPRYRTPGTEGHASTIPDLVAMLEEAGAETETQTFPVELPRLGKVNATNVYGVREGESDREIWIAAHWDSRAWADQAKDEARREEPVLGANDGAAGVAAAVHALEILPETNATVKVALFDVEDQGWNGEGWIEGSTHAAEQLNASEREAIEALLLVDMPGHEQLVVPREGRSDRHSPQVTELAFGVAERLGSPSFRNETGPPVLDDHVPFLERDVRALDLIHLDENGTSPFPWTWHTPHDTPEHVSAGSIAEVTRVVAGTAMAVDRGALPPRST